MYTLYLSPRYSADSRIMSDAAHAAGWNVVRLPKWEIPSEPPVGQPVVYGETLFARFMAEQLQFQLNDPPHDWLPALPYELRKRDVFRMTAGEARNYTKPAFIKPVDDKTFRAQVMTSGAELPDYLDANEVLLVAEPVYWEVEYRFFLLDGKALSGSVYCRDGELSDVSGSDEEFREAQSFAEAAATNLPRGVVVDTGRIRDRGWAVVEANPAWGAGIYHCDPEKILPAIAAACSM